MPIVGGLAAKKGTITQTSGTTSIFVSDSEITADAKVFVTPKSDLQISTSHNHTQNAHTHTQNAHNHNIPINSDTGSGITEVRYRSSDGSLTMYYASGTITNMENATPTINSTTATNNAASVNGSWWWVTITAGSGFTIHTKSAVGANVEWDYLIVY